MPNGKDIVKQYAEAKFILFPLNGKIPLTKEWQNTAYDPDPKINGNFGVLAGDKWLIIDIDIKNNAPGLASFAKLTADCNLAPGWEESTFVVQTGTGGFHIYLGVSQPLKLKRHHTAYPGIDFQSGNAFVVGAGSVHPGTGVVYSTVFRSPTQIAPAPAILLPLLEKTEIIELDPTPAIVDDHPINIERFVEVLANLPVASKGQLRNACYSAACRGRDLGLSSKVCAETLHKQYNGVKLDPPITDEEVEEAVTNAYRYAKGKQGSKNVRGQFDAVTVTEPIKMGGLVWNKDKNDKLTKSMRNCVNHVATTSEVSETFRFNTFNQSIEICSKAPWYAERGSKGANLEDDDETLLRYHLACNYHLEYKESTVWDAITIVAKKRQYHPVQNYLNSLVWDGIPRLDSWLIDYLKVEDNIYTRDIARKTLCAACKRIFFPGCKFDFVLILEGAQGAGKSTAASILGRLWYAEMKLDPGNKDSVINMFGKWIIELSEFSPSRFSDINALRAFFSNQSDTIRLPYAKLAKDFPRQSVFIGTINREMTGYLTDKTGNRRYWIAVTPASETSPIDIVGLENNADQIWAEAMTKYQTEPLFLTGDSAKIQQDMAQSRMPEEHYTKALLKWAEENPDKNEAEISDILEFLCIPLKNQSRLDAVRVAAAFGVCGWEHTDRRERGVHKVIYTRPLAERVRNAS